MGLSVYPPSSGVTTSDLITVPRGTYIAATSTASSNISFTNIPQTYRALRLYVYVTSTAGTVRVRMNNNTSFNHTIFHQGNIASTPTALRYNNSDGFIMPSNDAGSDVIFYMEIQNYTQTNELKPVVGNVFSSGISGQGTFMFNGVWPGLAAITGINIVNSQGNTVTPTEYGVNLYGVK